jgi:hypothetical protein
MQLYFSGDVGVTFQKFIEGISGLLCLGLNGL